MKKGILCRVLVLALIVSCFGGLSFATKSEAASIYFAGKYRCNRARDRELKIVPVTLKMNQYSSPEGSEVGNVEFEAFVPHCYYSESGTLKKIGKNLYRMKKGRVKITFKVYKKKVVVKQNRTGGNFFYNMSGTYKLKKRYYS